MSNKKFKVSSEGLILITKWEGFKADAYLDPIGVWTIGYGTIRWPDGRRVQRGDKITEAQARDLMEVQVNEHLADVAHAIKVSLLQNQIDAIASFVYNLGAPNFLSSTLLKMINAKRWFDAGEQFVRKVNGEWKGWIYAGGKIFQGLINRRLDEKKLFMRGVS